MRSSVPCSSWIDSFSLLGIQVVSTERLLCFTCLSRGLRAKSSSSLKQAEVRICAEVVRFWTLLGHQRTTDGELAGRNGGSRPFRRLAADISIDIANCIRE